MATLVRRLLSGRGGGQVNEDVADTNNVVDKEPSQPDSSIIEDDAPDRPFIMCSIYYLAVMLLIGVPMWFYTCSSTRFSLPDLSKFENKLSQTPRLHLDVSVIQLASHKNHHDYLRTNLPQQLNTSVEGLAYNINWRIRRPTQEESLLVKAIMRESDNLDRQKIFAKLESNLLKLHKPSNRFRLFMYLFEEPLNSLICDRPETYLINFERFIYLCPGEGGESLVNLINNALDETYRETVDLKRVKKILSGRTDLLVSLVPEYEPLDLRKLSQVADTIHAIYEKNVKTKYLELAEVLNIRLITQNFNKHSSHSDHHVLLRLPLNATDVTLEEHDSEFIMVGNSDKSLVLGLRAIVRRVIGLSSANLCKNCHVSRDVFINKWELDAIVGALTFLKLQSVLISLKSIGQHAIGIKIPKYVSTMAYESHELALKALDNLETKKPLEAYRQANSAYELSETAYYDPSLLETLYFPDETKYAIYLPLVMPLAIPIANSILRIGKYLLFGSSSSSRTSNKKDKIQ